MLFPLIVELHSSCALSAFGYCPGGGHILYFLGYIWPNMRTAIVGILGQGVASWCTKTAHLLRLLGFGFRGRVGADECPLPCRGH